MFRCAGSRDAEGHDCKCLARCVGAANEIDRLRAVVRELEAGQDKQNTNRKKTQIVADLLEIERFIKKLAEKDKTFRESLGVVLTRVELVRETVENAEISDK